MLPSREYELIKKKKVATQNVTGSLAKQRLTYTESYCDSKLLALDLTSELRFYLDVKQLWYCRVVLDQCTWWIPHTNKLVCDDSANVQHTLNYFISTVPRKKLIKHKAHLFVSTQKRSKVKITCILYHSKN